MRYTEVLSQYGYTESTISPAIRKNIGLIKEAQRAMNDAIEEDDAQLEAEIAGDIEAMDEMLCRSIEKYNSKKDMYKERGAKMQEGRKKAGGQISTEEPQVQSQEPQSSEGSGGSVIGWLLGVAVFGVAAFFGIKALKK